MAALDVRFRELLSPQMERLLSLLRPDKIETPFTISERFYEMRPGRYGYVNAGRGRGSGSLRATFTALERRGLVVADGHGWRLTDAGRARIESS